jgi:large subunit ribosomal protein L31
MKKALHPVYRTVVFQDIVANKSFVTRSTIPAKDTITWEDGKTYPLIKLDISGFSHPFYTGQQRIVDTAGRIDRFKKRFESTGGKTVERKKTTAVKRLGHVGADKKKVLSTAPKKEEAKPGDKKAKAPAKDKPAKKD